MRGAVAGGMAPLELLLDSTGEGIFGVDLDGHCTFINRAGARMLGLPPPQVLGRNMHELTHHSHADGTPYPDTDCPIFNAFRRGQPCRLDTEVFWQRVGIARAFSTEPRMLLLDEPFGALDALTRGTIQDELMAIVRRTRQTVFMITHDVDEAILLADRILLMSNGRERAGAWVPGGIAETVANPLPRDRTRAGLHHLPGYYGLRNHIVDFLVTRANPASH